MVNVGIIGMGMMGQVHLNVWLEQDNAQITAISDMIPERLTGKDMVKSNIDGQGSSFDPQELTHYSDGMKLIGDASIDIVDICVSTPNHRELAVAALEAGKHVLLEKPLTRCSWGAAQVVAAAEKASTFIMPAMCMRFWPGWDWLKQVVDDKRYGKVLGAQFQRLSSFPGGRFYGDGDLSGGAILDLHVHDTDFVNYLFGPPKAVSSIGYSKVTNKIDHVFTHYIYDDIPMVTAEGGWCMAEGFSFEMKYRVNFENATAVFDLSADETLKVYRAGKDAAAIELADGHGYKYEIAYFLDCVIKGRRPEIVTISDAAAAIKIYEAEKKSIADGQQVVVDMAACKCDGDK